MKSYRHFYQYTDIGAIYVYRNTHSKNAFELVAVSEHSQIPHQGIHILNRPFVSNGARFGSSLLSLGRLDSDIYEDFAVGSPYENSGKGVVYVFRGNDHFWAKEGKRYMLLK